MQVLAEGEDVHADGAQVIHGFQDFLIGLAQAQHQAGLGDDRGAMALGVLQHPQGLLVTGARITHLIGQAFDRLDVLREDLQAGVHHACDGCMVAIEVRGQGFHHHLRRIGLDRLYAGGVVGGAAVGQIVAVHRSQDDVAQGHQLHRLGSVLWFFLIQPAIRIAGVDCTEAAGAGAH